MKEPTPLERMVRKEIEDAERVGIRMDECPHCGQMGCHAIDCLVAQAGKRAYNPNKVRIDATGW